LRKVGGIFEDSNGKLNIQTLDDPPSVIPELNYMEPKFKSDAGAKGHVTRKAKQGSRYHKRALRLVGKTRA
jgi:hypothetical protein